MPPAGDRRDPHSDLFVGVDLLVTLDDDGNLARIVVTSAPGDPEPVLDLDITQNWRTPGHRPPGHRNAGPRRRVPIDELKPAGVHPVELGRPGPEARYR
jgi:hypothetical protein